MGRGPADSWTGPDGTADVPTEHEPGLPGFELPALDLPYIDPSGRVTGLAGGDIDLGALDLDDGLDADDDLDAGPMPPAGTVAWLVAQRAREERATARAAARARGTSGGSAGGATTDVETPNRNEAPRRSSSTVGPAAMLRRPMGAGAASEFTPTGLTSRTSRPAEDQVTEGRPAEDGRAEAGPAQGQAARGRVANGQHSGRLIAIDAAGVRTAGVDVADSGAASADTAGAGAADADTADAIAPTSAAGTDTTGAVTSVEDFALTAETPRPAADRHEIDEQPAPPRPAASRSVDPPVQTSPSTDDEQAPRRRGGPRARLRARAEARLAETSRALSSTARPPARPHPDARQQSQPAPMSHEPLVHRPPIEEEPSILGLTRHSRSKLGSRLFTWFFVGVFVLILVQLIVALLSP